jgi:hypothetical protein
MPLVEQFWLILEGAGYTVMNLRAGPMAIESLELGLEFHNTSGKWLPFVPHGSQTVRIVRKGSSWFFIYAHDSSTDTGLWGITENVFNQIKGQEIINWVIVLLKESETEGWWVEPANVEQLVRRQDWTQKSNGDYILNYPKGVSGCLPFHSRSELLTLTDGFAVRSVLVKKVR